MKKSNLLLVLIAGVLLAGCTKKNPTVVSSVTSVDQVSNNDSNRVSGDASSHLSNDGNTSDVVSTSKPLNQEDVAKINQFIDAVKEYYSVQGFVTITGEDGTFVHVIEAAFGEDYYVSKDVCSVAEYSEYYKFDGGKVKYGILQPDNTYVWQEVKEEGYTPDTFKNPFGNLSVDSFKKTEEGYVVEGDDYNLALITGWKYISAKAIFNINEAGNIELKVITQEKNGGVIENNEYVFGIGKPEDVNVYYKNNGDAKALDAAFKAVGKNFTVECVNHEDGYEDIVSTIYCTENNIYDAYDGAIRSPSYYKDALGYTYSYYYSDESIEIKIGENEISMRYGDNDTITMSNGDASFYCKLDLYRSNTSQKEYYGTIQDDVNDIFQGQKQLYVVITEDDVIINDKDMNVISRNEPGYNVELFRYNFDEISIDLSDINAEAFKYDATKDVYYPVNRNVFEYYAPYFGYSYDKIMLISRCATDMEIKLTSDNKLDYIYFQYDVYGNPMSEKFTFSDFGTTKIDLDMDEIMKSYVEVPKEMPQSLYGIYKGEVTYDSNHLFDKDVTLIVKNGLISINGTQFEFVEGIVNKDKSVEFIIKSGDLELSLSQYYGEGTLSFSSNDGTLVSGALNISYDELEEFYGSYSGEVSRDTIGFGLDQIELEITKDGITLNGESCAYLGVNNHELTLLYKGYEFSLSNDGYTNTYGLYIYTDKSFPFMTYLDKAATPVVPDPGEEEEELIPNGTYVGTLGTDRDNLFGNEEISIEIKGKSAKINGEETQFIDFDDGELAFSYNGVTFYVMEGYEEGKIMVYTYDGKIYGQLELSQQEPEEETKLGKVYSGRIYYDTPSLFNTSSIEVFIANDGSKITFNGDEVTIVSHETDTYNVVYKGCELTVYYSDIYASVYNEDYSFCTADLEPVEVESGNEEKLDGKTYSGRIWSDDESIFTVDTLNVYIANDGSKITFNGEEVTIESYNEEESEYYVTYNGNELTIFVVDEYATVYNENYSFCTTDLELVA